MKFSSSTTTSWILLSASFSAWMRVEAFIMPSHTRSDAGWHLTAQKQPKAMQILSRQPLRQHQQKHQQRALIVQFAASQETGEKKQNAQDSTESEIERLRSMAAKLRAEAAALEAKQAQGFADAAERAFRKFDTNHDGQVTFAELKNGLEKVLKEELPDGRVRKLLEKFDTSKDGALQLEEFVSLDRFRNQLDAIRRDERRSSQEAAKVAQLEAEAAQFAQARLEILNDRPPTTADKVLSVLPFLFPLLDSLQFGRFFFNAHPDNPIVPVVALLFQLYRSIPFGGFIAFFALSFLSANPSINRLVRFNMQQAIYLDIALFFPGLIGALYSLVFANLLGVQIPEGVGELSSDVVFATVVLAIVYSSVSSLLGITPDKIPFISQAASERMPTIDMFDDQGRFIPRNPRTKDEDEKKKDDEEKN